MKVAKRPFIILVLCISVVILGVILKNYVTPFFVLFSCLTICLIGFAPRSSTGRVIAYNLAAVVAAVGLFEFYETLPTLSPQRAGTYASKDYLGRDPDYGYAIKPGQRVVTSTLKAPDGSTIYDVKYSINQFGFRTTSTGDAAETKSKPVFFVGDSFTFGEGVSDEDTLPQQFSKLSGLQAVSFGVHGYGGHQVLRQLQLDLLRSIDSRDPLAIVYTLLPTDHMLRSGGRASWDQDGPRYEIIDGKLEYLGGSVSYNAPLWQRTLRYSSIYNRNFAYKCDRAVTHTDRERLLAIILEIQNLSLQKYHAPLIIVEWADTDPDAEWLYQKLQENGVPAFFVLPSIPELRAEKYSFPLDHHPTGAAYTLVAAKLETMLRENLHSSLQP
jgi:hypothetical protein